MRFDKLSATKSDGKTPAFVKISNTLLKPKLPDGKPDPVELRITADRFEYPQYDSIEEVTAAAGGADELLRFINRAVQGEAIEAGKIAIRTASSGDVSQNYEDIISNGLNLTKNWTPAKQEKITAAEAKRELEEIKTNIDALTPEELYERMKKMFGK